MNRVIRIESQDELHKLFGPQDENIRVIEKQYKVKITLRDDYLKINGTSVGIKKAAVVLEKLLAAIRNRQLEEIGRLDVSLMIDSTSGKRKNTGIEPEMQFLSGAPNAGMRIVGPRTPGQNEYFQAIKEHDIVFGVGPAGTGKTYLAMASAVQALNKREVRRIILTRPALEAGESLGYLPGDIHEKISPYLRPLYDALYDMMEAERIEKYLETGIIEVAPLAYMRGRTLNEAFIILDEAQNCTIEQMKMFLTRLGFDSKAVITGDLTQSDLPGGKPAGLLQATELLNTIEGIKFVYFSGNDVVRHPLVQRIIEAYEQK